MAPSRRAGASQLRLHRRVGVHGAHGARGDERAVDVLTAFRALLRDICSRRGVRIAKWLGDGVMLVCVETRPLLETMLEAALRRQRRRARETVSIRSGVIRAR